MEEIDILAGLKDNEMIRVFTVSQYTSRLRQCTSTHLFQFTRRGGWRYKVNYP